MKPAAAIRRPNTKASVPILKSEGDYRLEDQVGHLMRRAHQRHTAIFQDGIPELTPTQFAALVKIRDEGQVSQNQLGRLTAMDPATIQGVIQRLEARKLLAREPDPEDGRRAILRLTPAGQAAAADAVTRAKQITDSTLAPLSATERQAFLTLLKKLT
jgi:MarR family transcriptional regulator, lower aerobic nicotinate degradation pathway regulator